MRAYHRLIFYVIFGFLFITLYLIALIVSTRMTESVSNNEKSSLFIGKISNQSSTDIIGTELTEEQTIRLLRRMESVNNDRIQRVEEICQKYNLGIFKTSRKKSLEHPPVPQYSVFYFDRENKLTFCPIYKAGSTTWLFNLCLLAGMTEEEIEKSKHQLSDLARSKYPELEPTAAEEAFQKSVKILTVRHPFERLLSAYRDKLENINYGREHGTLYFYSSYGRKIVKKYRKGGNETKTWDLLKASEYSWDPDHPKPEGIEPTFREFVLYLINLNLAHYSDDHWIPYYLFCTPCLLRYDIIAKVETLDSDQLYSIHVLGLQSKIKPRWKHRTQFYEGNQSPEKPSPLAKIYFAQLNIYEINQLYSKYQVDFELFGYDHKEYLKYASNYHSQR